MGSEREILQHGEKSMPWHDLAEKWQKELNEFVCGTVTNPLGRLRQAALVTEGLIFGGIAEIDKANPWEVAVKGGEAAIAGGALGLFMASKYGKAYSGAVKLAGGLGLLTYGATRWDHYSKDQGLTAALDTVYKSSDLRTFNGQVSAANTSLGKEGFDLGIMTLAGGVGAIGGFRYGPGMARKYGPSQLRNAFMHGPYPMASSAIFSARPAPAFTEYGRATSGVAAEAAEIVDTNIPFNKVSHQQELNQFVSKVIDGRIKVEPGETARYDFDRSGNLTGILVQDGAAESEIARQMLVGSSVGYVGESNFAREAAMAGAQKAGYHIPRPGETITAAELLPYRDSFKPEEFLANRAMQRYAIEGAEAYYNGESGNDYTSYLRKVFGEWTVERNAASESMLSRPLMPMETNDLSSLGLKPTISNRAAVSNPWINSMTKADQAKTIRAVSQYLEKHPTVAELTGVEKDAAIGKLASELTPTEIEIITDTYARTLGCVPQSLDKDLVAATKLLVDQGIVKNAKTAHQLLTRIGSHVSKENLDAGVQFIKSACEAGLSESQMMADEIPVSIRLQQLLTSSSADMIPDYAHCLKILGAETTYEDICAVNALRYQNWDLNRLNKFTLAAAKRIVMLGELPTKENIMEQLSKSFLNDMKFNPPKDGSPE